MEKIFHTNGNKADKTDFKTKTVTKDKKHHIMIKGSIQKDVKFVNEEPNYINITRSNITRLKREMNSNTIIIENFNTPTYSNKLIIQREKSTRKYKP